MGYFMVTAPFGWGKVVSGPRGCFMPHGGAVERHFEFARFFCGDWWGWVGHTSVASFEAEKKRWGESGSTMYWLNLQRRFKDQ